MYGWDIVVQSWRVLQKDKELVVFPILSGLACFMVMASFAIPILAIPELRDPLMNVLDEDAKDPQQQLVARAVGMAISFVFYFINFFIVIFLNTALVSCAIIRFKGGNPTVSDGLSAAMARLPQIFMWSLVAATVGMILRAIEERAGFVGKIVIGLIGMAWAIATYFVVPVLAVERVGPFDAIKRSVQILRDCWGEGLVGNLSLGLINFLLALVGIAIIVGGVFLGISTESIILGVAVASIGVVYLIVLAIVMSTLKQIFLAGLYLYAAEHRVPEGFDEELMRNAFRHKG